MLKKFQKNLQFNIKKLSLKASFNNQINLFQKFSFSGGGHHSGSESEHDHHHQSSTTDVSESEDTILKQKKRLFSKKVEKFSVDNLLDSMKVPISKQEEKLDQSSLNLFKTDKEYIQFLTVNFEKQAVKRYPEYKTHLNEFKDRIRNYDTLNSYQKEVHTLNSYMIWKLEKLRDETSAFDTKDKNPLDQIRDRFQLISKITKTSPDDHHHESRIMHHVKEKLQEVITQELEFEEFKASYNKEIESNIISKIIEKKNFFYGFQQNKAETNLKLASLTSPMNPKKAIYDATMEEHIHPQKWLDHPQQEINDRFKYFAYFDLILDNHMRQVRPNNVLDDPLTYVKPNNRPLNFSENDFCNNMWYDYFFTLNNEVTEAFKHDMDLVFAGKEDQIGKIKNHVDDHHHGKHLEEHGHKSVDHEEDSHHEEKHHEVDPDENPDRPTLKLWKDKHKFPHVADRLGWDILGEYPWDKNPLFERIYSHPAYQWQPFVQVPPLNPHEDLNFEEGETIYENKWVGEWVKFWRIMFLMLPIPVFIFIYESYLNQTVNSPEYMNRFSLFIPNNNMGHRGLDRPLMEKVKFWGKDMWMWQHWIRKSIYYSTMIMLGVVVSRIFNKIGREYVSKMVYNRQRDLVFVWRHTGFFRQKMDIFELHYLEQFCPHLVMGWKDLGQFKEDGITTVTDLRYGQLLSVYNEKKYWNIDQREHFLHNTTTYWRGLRAKNVDRGIFINNDYSVDPSEADFVKKTQNEIKLAIEKFGPLMMNDFDYNYKYQFYKKTYDEKKKIINQSLAN